VIEYTQRVPGAGAGWIHQRIFELTGHTPFPPEVYFLCFCSHPYDTTGSLATTTELTRGGRACGCRALTHGTYYIAQDVWLPPPGAPLAHAPCTLHRVLLAISVQVCLSLVRGPTQLFRLSIFVALRVREHLGVLTNTFFFVKKVVLEHWRRVNLLQHLFCGDAGVCGLGPATRLLRRMNSLLRFELVRRESQEENEENVRKCLVVQRKDGGGREVTNHDELLRALNLLPSSCAGRWQVGCLWHRS
jgi:hypothetical protein